MRRKKDCKYNFFDDVNGYVLKYYCLNFRNTGKIKGKLE